MPYELVPVKGGYKVAKKDTRKEYFSAKPLTREKAIAQMRSLYAAEFRKK